MSTNVAVITASMKTALAEFSSASEVASHMLPVAKSRIHFARNVAGVGKFARRQGRPNSEVAKAILDEFPTKQELVSEFWFCDEALKAPVSEDIIREACVHLAAIMANGAKAINPMKVAVLVSELMAGDIEGSEAVGYHLHFGPVHVLYAVREIIRRDDFFPTVATMLKECRRARDILQGHRAAADSLLAKIQWATDQLDPAGRPEVAIDG